MTLGQARELPLRHVTSNDNNSASFQTQCHGYIETLRSTKCHLPTILDSQALLGRDEPGQGFGTRLVNSNYTLLPHIVTGSRRIRAALSK